MINLFSSVIGALLISAVMTGLMRRYALSRQLMDIPNSRSSHEVATPRGGGAAIVVGFIFMLIIMVQLGEIPQQLFSAILPAVLVVAAVGFLDDHGHVSAKYRIIVHFSAVIWAMYLIDGNLMIHMPQGVVVSGWLVSALAMVAMVWFLNLFNFMDGIDGIAVGEGVFVALAGAALTWYAELEGISLSFLILGAASLGFLFWNWPPAKIFMGDVGSGFLGIALAILSYAAVIGDGATLWSWVILAAVFVVDATITLARRFFRGEMWYKPHRSHAYQWAARRWGHLAATTAVTIINICWLLPLAYYAFLHPAWGVIISIVAYVPLALLAVFFDAGRQER